MSAPDPEQEKAMNILKSRLYQYYEEQRDAEKKKEESSKTDMVG